MGSIWRPVTGPLTSWTRTLNEDDALLLLEAAQPGERLDDWVERAHALLPQPSRPRRTETIRMVRRSLLDLTSDAADPCVADTRYLQLIRQGAARLRLDLLYGRYLFENAWIDRALTELIHPALANSEEPLAPDDVAVISDEAWAGFVARHLKPGTGRSSITKTRSHLVTNLTRLGVLRVESVPGQETRAQRGEPARLAFGWLVGHEIRTHRLGEIAEHVAAARSQAARLFAPSAAYAEQSLAESIDAGLLRQGHLVGQARIYEGAL